jgi:hypothetical protein
MLDGQVPYCSELQMLEFAGNNDALVCLILALTDTYRSLRGHLESLEGVISCLSAQSIAQSAVTGCVTTAQFHPKPAFDADFTRVLKISKNLPKSERNK